MRPLALLATVAALAAAAPAGAATTPDFRPADSYLELGAVLPVARGLFPQSPCRDREMVAWQDGLLTWPGLPGVYTGLAWEPYCAVMLTRDLLHDTRALCVVVSHEFGHLAGLGHSDDPANLMHNPAPLRFAPCQRLGAGHHPTTSGRSA